MSGRWTQIRQEFTDYFDQIEKYTSFILANLLWSLSAVFIITLPAATAALFSVMSLRVRGKQPDTFTEFFGAMRRYWLKSTLIMLLNLAIGGLLVFNLTLFPHMDMSNPLAFLARSVTWFVGIALVLTNLYIWSLLVLLDMSLKQLLETSLKLVFIYPVWTFGVLVAVAIPVLISLLLPQGIFLLVTMSACALIVTMGTWRVIRRHLTEDELTSLEAAHQPQ